MNTDESGGGPRDDESSSNPALEPGSVVQPPEPTEGASGAGQEEHHQLPAVFSGSPSTPGIYEIPEVFSRARLASGNDQFISDLLASTFNNADRERETLRADARAAVASAERCRARNQELAVELADVRARWESFSKLMNVQSLLYIVGGLLLGPQIPVLSGAGEVSPALLTVGSILIVAAFVIGTMGPKRTK